MDNTFKFLSCLVLSIILPITSGWSACFSGGIADRNPVKVIFETDMGNDIDDALALAMLYRYAEQGKVEIIGISNNKQSENSSKFIDIMNKWYNFPKIPIGTVVKGKRGEVESKSFAKKVVDEYKKDKSVSNSREIDFETKVEESVSLYRQILSAEPDHSVIIISVGFFTNLARLLDSGPDKFSALNGKELVARKVKFLSAMAGNFSTPASTEFNVRVDIPSAKKVYEQWPGIIFSSPFEIGNEILFPASFIEDNLGYTRPNPLVEGYKLYFPMPYDRPTWDLTAALFAIEPERGYFTTSNPGLVRVNEEGYTRFTEDTNGTHFYLMLPDSTAKNRILSRFIELINAN
ncbi:nucleoside hydrolase [Arenibacter latericius]|uniref:nucleoside hydrolase n=1 Tax=Arenibacter latericius TaxID=86104 RepID=UPI000418A5AE|nr:nucleoside hydrolase [Arenibacter latericius]